MPLEIGIMSIPILIDAERKREGLDDLLKFSDYVAWTEAPSVPSALVAMLLRLPNVKFVIVTLGEDGCIMLQRSVTEGDQSEEMDIDSLLESLKQRNDSNTVIPTCVSSVVTKLRAHGMGTVSGRLFVGTAEKIPSSELVDTTGAGDAFIGAVLYAICASMQPEKMLLFAAQVAAAGCRALGARAVIAVPGCCLWLLGLLDNYIMYARPNLLGSGFSKPSWVMSCWVHGSARNLSDRSCLSLIFEEIINIIYIYIYIRI
ncbi:hypothetical protein HYC85_025061 [Camellia sinensis]|uniref:Carbohydrate kinase PfkB domain-containing protein n=1 Tax=Camellia sinensis TaxID=4442 RepID=A0A7J7GB82_CAMSI|nr:hypothetical protein HYC85_025061 [Camellia sinensis]